MSNPTNNEIISPFRSRRPTRPKNRLSKRQRILSFTPFEIRKVQKLFEIKELIETEMEELALIGLFGHEWKQLYRDICAALRRLVNYDPRTLILHDRNTLKISKFNNVNEARLNFGDDVFFEHVFGHSPKMVKQLSDLFFREETIIVPKKGEIGGELAMLLLLCRLRNTMSTLTVIAQLMGKRHETWVSMFLRHTILFIQARYEHILSRPNLHVFQSNFEKWKLAVEKKYRQIHDHQEDIPSRYAGCCVFVDCVRLLIARPQYGQEVFYNGWLGNHSITRLVLSSPCGLFLYSPGGAAGHENDQRMANLANLEDVLADEDIYCMADKGFYSSAHILAFPKSHDDNAPSPAQMKALSALRTAGSEWPFSHLKLCFPYLVYKWKQKIFLTLPETFMVVAMLLTNVINLLKGRQNHIFFDLDSAIDAKEYLSIPFA